MHLLNNIDKNIEFINEFGLLPVNLEMYFNMEGYVIFSSENITNTLKELISRSSLTSEYSDKINRMIDERKIIIGYENKSKMQFLWMRLRKYKNSGYGNGILGSFINRFKKMIIILDENVDILGQQVQQLPPRIAHELMHYLACIKSDDFIKATSDIMINYYTYFLSPIVDTLLDKNEIFKLIKILNKNYDVGHETGIASPSELKKIWYNFFKIHNIDNNKSYALASAIIIPYLYNILDYKSTELKNLNQKITDSLFNAYKHIGITNARNITLVGQEIIFPSEIIAVCSQVKISKEIGNLI